MLIPRAAELLLIVYTQGGDDPLPRTTSTTGQQWIDHPHEDEKQARVRLLSFCRHKGVVNTGTGWERSVQIRKEEMWKLSVSLRSTVFSRSADRSAKNREISIDLSL